MTDRAKCRATSVAKHISLQDHFLRFDIRQLGKKYHYTANVCFECCNVVVSLQDRFRKLQKKFQANNVTSQDWEEASLAKNMTAAPMQ